MNALPPAWTVRHWVAIVGVALVLVALVLSIGADASGASRAWTGAALLIAGGLWLERRSDALRTFGHILLAGGIATVYGILYSAHRHVLFTIADLWWFGVLQLALVGEVITRCAGKRNSVLFAAVGFGLCALSATLQPFTAFYLCSDVALAASAGWFLVRYGGAIVGWVTLPILYAGFLVWWPFDDGRIDADRYLELAEYWQTLAGFAIVWALFAWNSSLAKFPAGRLSFVTLNNALFLALSLLIVPPRHPDWSWKFTLVFGAVLLVAGALTRGDLAVRRGYFIQGALLAVLGVVSALTGREAAAMLAVASAFCVLTVARREQWLLRDLAYVGALLAAVRVWMALRDHAPHGLRLGALVGAVIVGCACWIEARRALWERWAVAIFAALGLGVWLLTTLYFTPEMQRAPVLAIEAVLLTVSFAPLRVREIPWLAKAFLPGALLVWFMQLEAFVRPWWHPVVLVLATLGISAWWQTRGRSLLPAWELRWVQGVAAAASAIILLLWIESRLGRQPPALVAMSVLAVAVLLLALAMRDHFLAAASQLFTITAIGEFIGQHTTAPLPGALPALAPIAALHITAPVLRKVFASTDWERPVGWVATLCVGLAAALFVAWTLHYVAPAYRFLVLASVAMVLLLQTIAAPSRGSLLASLVCSSGALLAFWIGWTGQHGFHLRDLAAFILLLGFGVIGRRTRVLPEPLQQIGIVLGLASVVHWVTLWAPVHFPAVPLPVVWAVVAAIVCYLGWWLDEPLYRGIAWALLAAALGWTLCMEMQAGPRLRAGLLAIGVATLLALFASARRRTTA